jgi:signal transduction histidine kinase
MNIYLILAYTLLSVSFLIGFLGFLVILKNLHQSKVNYAVAVTAFASSLYSLSAAIVYFQGYFKQDYHFAYGACEIGMLAIPAFLQAIYYLEDPNSRKAFWVGWILYPFFILATVLEATTNWVESSPPSLIPYIPGHAPLDQPMHLVETGIIIWATVLFLLARKRLKGMKRVKINYCLLGAIIYGGCGILFTGFLQFFAKIQFEPSLTSYFCLPWVALTFYSITRYRLFDVQIIISRSLSTIILIIIFEIINIGIFHLFVSHVGITWANVISMFVVIVVFLSTPLRRFIQGGLTDRFVGDKYNYQNILKESSEAIVTILDQEEMLNYLIHVIQQCFKIYKACLFLKNAEGSYVLHSSWGINKKFVAGYRLEEKQMMEWLKNRRQIFIKEEQQGLMTEENFSRLYGNFEAIDAFLILPLFFKNNLIGLLTFGSKDDDLPYLQSDVDILQVMASQTAIAIENARLYNEAFSDRKAKEEIEKAEKALQKQSEELARSNRELEQFAYIASHDLQEPLRMVSSFCQKLESRYKDKLDQDANEYIHFAVDGAKRMQLLIDALLSYARVGKKEVTIQEVDLNKVLLTILHDLDAVIKQNDATIKVGELPVVMANQIQMSQLFQNFMTNALKFKGERKPVVEISSRKEKEGWEFVVSDNGIGIDEKHFPKMFAIFHRLHERGNYPGTGIGLALCKKIVENFNGKIWVTSKVGEGTSFHFTLDV